MSLIPSAGSEKRPDFQAPDTTRGKLGDHDLQQITPNSPRVQAPPSKGKAEKPIALQRSGENVPPRVSDTTARFIQTPLQNTALKAIREVVYPKGPFTQFNALANEIKGMPGWQEAIKSQVARLNPQSMQLLLSKPLVELRGYDREVLKAIYEAAKALHDTPEIRERLNSLETKILHVEKKDMKVLGGGAVNTVYLVKYIDPATKEEVEAVFKPEIVDASIKESLFGTAQASGIPAGIDAHLPSRAVASSIVDRQLYGDRTISVKTEFAIVNGERGILMQKAKGKSPKMTGVKKEPVNLNDQPKVRALLMRQIQREGELTKLDAKLFAAVLKVRSVEMVDGKLMATSASFEHFDPKNPTTARDLVRLQIKDIITGECDRHPQNYFIDQDGKVTGIDEDCCFGKFAIPEKGDVREQDSLKFIIPNNGSLMLRMPPVITREIKEEIDKLYTNQSDLRKSLEPYISKEEIDATITRLKKLHDHIQEEGGTCLIVETNEELLSDTALQRMDSNNSYLMRELLVYDKDQKGWNYLRAHR